MYNQVKNKQNKTPAYIATYSGNQTLETNVEYLFAWIIWIHAVGVVPEWSGFGAGGGTSVKNPFGLRFHDSVTFPAAWTIVEVASRIGR